jgi:hypothetical protein
LLLFALAQLGHFRRFPPPVLLLLLARFLEVLALHVQ